MRRKECSEEKEELTLDEKKKNEKAVPGGKMNIMKLNWIRICFLFLIIAALGVYVYFYMWTEKLPFEMSPKMEALYRKHGEGEAKPRRRPYLEEDGLPGGEVDAKKEVKAETGADGAKKEKAEKKRNPVPSDSIHVAIVACGDRAPEAITSLKSFAIFAKQDLHFHVFAEEELHEEFNKEIKKWPQFISGNIRLDIRPIQFPSGQDFNQWKTLFKPCASQRLFLPLLLTDVDAVLYVDTDVLLLRPVEDVWEIFKNFNKTQIAGLAPEGQVDATGWYNRFALHPYYGRLGVNSGVMLMNLTRMRKINWNSDIYPIYKEYHTKITWGDQDILNIMFHFKPEQLYVFPCEWNYRPDHCMYGNNCDTAHEQGISVVHGNRQVFQNDKQPEFKAIYEVFRDYKLGKDAKSGLKGKIDRKLESYKSTYCGEVRHLFTKRL